MIWGDPSACKYGQNELGKWEFSKDDGTGYHHSGPGNYDVNSERQGAALVVNRFPFDDSSYSYMDKFGPNFMPSESGPWSGRGTMTLEFTCKGTDGAKVSSTIVIEAPKNFTVP
ncbi:MAG: hypothetical protein ACTHKU_12625 [Verrucomicrobiota bacterium]